jgi:hypothetical protein
MFFHYHSCVTLEKLHQVTFGGPVPHQKNADEDADLTWKLEGIEAVCGRLHAGHLGRLCNRSSLYGQGQRNF